MTTRTLDEMSAFEAVLLLRRAFSKAPHRRWIAHAYGFIGRRAALRWARVCLQRARVCFEKDLGLDGIDWILNAERWRNIAQEYPEQAFELLHEEDSARGDRRELRLAKRALMVWPSRAAAERP